MALLRQAQFPMPLCWVGIAAANMCENVIPANECCPQMVGSFRAIGTREYDSCQVECRLSSVSIAIAIANKGRPCTSYILYEIVAEFAVPGGQIRCENGGTIGQGGIEVWWEDASITMEQ
jgi:hypothetical protein